MYNRKTSELSDTRFGPIVGFAPADDNRDPLMLVLGKILSLAPCQDCVLSLSRNSDQAKTQRHWYLAKQQPFKGKDRAEHRVKRWQFQVLARSRSNTLCCQYSPHCCRHEHKCVEVTQQFEPNVWLFKQRVKLSPGIAAKMMMVSVEFCPEPHMSRHRADQDSSRF